MHNYKKNTSNEMFKMHFLCVRYFEIKHYFAVHWPEEKKKT